MVFRGRSDHAYHVNLSIHTEHVVSIHRLDAAWVREAFRRGDRLVLSCRVARAASGGDFLFQLVMGPLLLMLFVFPLLTLLVVLADVVLGVAGTKSLPVALAGGYVMTFVYWFRRHQAWRDFRRRKLLACTEELVIDFTRQALVATETFEFFPGRNRQLAMPLQQVTLRVQKQEAAYDSDVPDDDSFRLWLKPGNGSAFSGMPWVADVLSYAFYRADFKGDEAAARADVEGVMKAFAGRLGA